MSYNFYPSLSIAKLFSSYSMTFIIFSLFLIFCRSNICLGIDFWFSFCFDFSLAFLFICFYNGKIYPAWCSLRFLDLALIFLMVQVCIYYIFGLCPMIHGWFSFSFFPFDFMKFQWTFLQSHWSFSPTIASILMNPSKSFRLLKKKILLFLLSLLISILYLAVLAGHLLFYLYIP